MITTAKALKELQEMMVDQLRRKGFFQRTEGNPASDLFVTFAFFFPTC